MSSGLPHIGQLGEQLLTITYCDELSRGHDGHGAVQSWQAQQPRIPSLSLLRKRGQGL